MEEETHFKTARKGLHIIAKACFPFMVLFAAVVFLIDGVHCYAFYTLGITSVTPSFFWEIRLCELVAVTGASVLFLFFLHDLSSDISPFGFKQAYRLKLCGMSFALQWLTSFVRFPSNVIAVVSEPISIRLAAESGPDFTKLVLALFLFCAAAILRYTAVLQEDSASIL